MRSASRPPDPVHPLLRRLADLVQEVGRAQDDGVLAVGDLDSAALLLRLGEAVQGLALRELAAVDRTRSWAAAGRASAAGWLGQVLVLDEGAARGRVRLAHRLADDLAPLGDLLRAGGTTVGHTRAVAAGLRGIGPDVVSDSMPALCLLAGALDPPSLARELRERAHAVSDDLAREQERRQRQRTGLHCDELLDGCVSVRGLLSPEDGQALLIALDAVVHGQRRAGDERDAPLRRADALVALAHHALSCDGAALPAQGGSRAQLLVLVPERTLAGRAGAPAATFPASAALLTERALLRLACDADVSRVVLSAEGVVLDLGRSTRTVSPAQWRALVARDRSCVVRRCRARPTQCQAHHVRHWSRGGPSDLENYALLCHTHHHQVHDGERWLEHRDGRWVTPDGWVDLRPAVGRQQVDVRRAEPSAQRSSPSTTRPGS